MAFIARYRIVGAISLVAFLGGCTYLPEYVDPIDWADSANEWVTGSILGDGSLSNSLADGLRFADGWQLKTRSR